MFLLPLIVVILMDRNYLLLHIDQKILNLSSHYVTLSLILQLLTLLL